MSAHELTVSRRSTASHSSRALRADQQQIEPRPWRRPGGSSCSAATTWRTTRPPSPSTAPELLVTHESAVALVREFAEKGKVVAIIGQGHLLLAAAGLLRGRRCASGVPMRVVSRLAGAAAVENGGAVADGKLVTAAAWTDLAPFVARVVDLLGISVSF
ncbi:unnamed protein product [Urochloa humidicola]